MAVFYLFDENHTTVVGAILFNTFIIFYIRNNAGMTLEEFKWIWHMEYGHRMWGRAVGAAFLLPAIYFWKKKWFIGPMKTRVIIFGSLILGQVSITI